MTPLLFGAHEHRREIYHHREADGGYQEIAEAYIAVHISPYVQFSFAGSEIRAATFITADGDIHAFQLFYRRTYFCLDRRKNFIEIRKITSFRKYFSFSVFPG